MIINIARVSILKLIGIYLIALFLVSFSFRSNSKTIDKVCIGWFQNSKIKAGTKDCELNCAILKVDMSTFICINQCKELCKFSSEESLLAKFILYPGLTPAEKQLAAKYPKQAYVVYQQKGIAEDSTDRHFPNQDLNDESDAFRHFAIIS